jgi:hypothetical protein
VEAFNIGADVLQLLDDLFVAAIDVVHALDDGFALGHEGSEDSEDRRSVTAFLRITQVETSRKRPRNVPRFPQVSQLSKRTKSKCRYITHVRAGRGSV